MQLTKFKKRNVPVLASVKLTRRVLRRFVDVGGGQTFLRLRTGGEKLSNGPLT